MSTLGESVSAPAAASSVAAPADSDIKISDIAASAGSSKSTSPTDSVNASADISSSTSSSPNPVNNTGDAGNTDSSLLDADANTHSDSNTENANSLHNNDTTDKYITRMISGDEILLPRKDILIAVMKEYATEKKTEEEKIKGEVEESGKQVTSANKEVAAAEEALRAAEKRIKEANEKRGIAILKDTELKERAMKAKLTVEDVDVQLNDAEDAPIAAIAGFLEKVQNSIKEGNEVEVKGVDGSGNPNNVGETEGKDVGHRTPVAGKRKREEDSSEEHDEPPSKERKLDESQENGDVKLPEGAEMDAELGLVFNSPFRPQFDIECAGFFGDNEKISSTSTSKISIKASTLRPFVLAAINEYRAKLGQRPVPLLELIFLVNGENAKSVEDGDQVSENVLLSSEMTVGIKHYPELTFEKLMAPFQRLSQWLVQEEARHLQKSTSDTAEAAATSHADPAAGRETGADAHREIVTSNGGRADGNGTANAADANGVASSTTSAAESQTSTANDQPKSQWWEGGKRMDGTTINVTERQAIKLVALYLCRVTEHDNWLDGAALRPAFLRHHWADLARNQRDARIGFDLNFARTRVTVNGYGEYWAPKENAFIVAEFQLSDSERDPASLLRLFPKYSASLIAGFKWTPSSMVCKGSLMTCLRVIMNLTSGVSALRHIPEPWAWHPRIPELKGHEFKMPLIAAFEEDYLPRSSVRGLLQSLLRCRRAVLTDPCALKHQPSISTGIAADYNYWHLKECIVQSECKTEDTWRKKFNELEERARKKLNTAKEKNKVENVRRWEEQIALFEDVRKIEGWFERPGKSIVLQKATVLRLDIQKDQ